MKGTWIVFEMPEPGPAVGHFVPKENKTSICGLNFYQDLRRWNVAQDVGIIPLCETCKMLSLDTPRKKHRRAARPLPTPRATEKKP